MLFWSIFNRVIALDRHQNFVYAQYLVNLFVDFDQILYIVETETFVHMVCIISAPIYY